MPLIKSTSKRAFGENIARERAAGKPIKQAVAIAYAEKRSAGKPGSNPPSSQGESRVTMHPSNASTVEAAHHSSHSAKRSEHYHSRVADIVKPVQIDSGKNKMTRSIHAKSSMEEDTASDGDAFRG